MLQSSFFGDPEKPKHGVGFDTDEAEGVNRDRDFQLGKKNQRQGHDAGVAKFSQGAVIKTIDSPIDFEKIVGRDNAEFDELITQVKIDERVIDQIQHGRQDKKRSEMQKNDVKEDHVQPVGDDVNFPAENRFLFEMTSDETVEPVDQPVNEKSDVIVERIPPKNRKGIKNQGTADPDERQNIGFTENRFGASRLKESGQW
jgi:hypothetical protein